MPLFFSETNCHGTIPHDSHFEFVGKRLFFVLFSAASNLAKFRREVLAGIINRSINETLSRTIITLGIAVLVLLALFSFGGHVIRPFAFTLIIGFITGTYSSIYIAAPVVFSFERGGSLVARLEAVKGRQARGPRK